MSTHAPGWPGSPARWTSSAKSGVGRARSPVSHVWFTIGHGILNEVYYGRVDNACLRDLGLIVTADDGFFSEEKRHTDTEIEPFAPGVPGYRVTNTCREGRYRIEKEILADPHSEVILQRIRFVPLKGAREDYRVHVLLAPHLGNSGGGNTGFVGDFKGVPMLFATRGALALALATSTSWRARSAGFVGQSDGWQDLRAHGRISWEYDRAENGNVALCGELETGDDPLVLSLGFGVNESEAGQRVRSSLLRSFDAVRERYVQQWQAWQGGLTPLETMQPRPDDLYRCSTAVLFSHEASNFPGGFIASLSIPWGSSKGDDDLGGYHLVWPRDLAETVGGLMAAGASDEVHRAIHYLHSTQEADGHWPQNMWLDGSAYWSGTQLDETAFPIILVGLAEREGILTMDQVRQAWPMVRKAAAFLAANGPCSQEDRWEEDAGYSPFTMAVEIAALLIAARHAEGMGEPDVAAYLRETADAWNDGIDRWIYASGTPLAQRVGVAGYYVRITPPDDGDGGEPIQGAVIVKNRPGGADVMPATELVSPDALALVRFGLRAADDPRIVDTVKVIDTLLRVETPNGPCWYRYNDDGYGEHPDGSPFDGWGVGRLWPLLTGERGHYELAAGRPAEAERMLAAMERFAGVGGMLPEQVWDGEDIPERDLSFGRPAGSAMPLAWAHSEYIKLRRSLVDGHVFDMPRLAHERYVVQKQTSAYTCWRFNHKTRRLREGTTLRVELRNEARVRWSTDSWATSDDVPTHDPGLGVHIADLPTASLPAGALVDLTFYWTEAGRWEGTNFTIEVEPAPLPISAPQPTSP